MSLWDTFHTINQWNPIPSPIRPIAALIDRLHSLGVKANSKPKAIPSPINNPIAPVPSIPGVSGPAPGIPGAPITPGPLPGVPGGGAGTEVPSWDVSALDPWAGVDVQGIVNSQYGGQLDAIRKLISSAEGRASTSRNQAASMWGALADERSKNAGAINQQYAGAQGNIGNIYNQATGATNKAYGSAEANLVAQLRSLGIQDAGKTTLGNLATEQAQASSGLSSTAAAIKAGLEGQRQGAQDYNTSQVQAAKGAGLNTQDLINSELAKVLEGYEGKAMDINAAKTSSYLDLLTRQITSQGATDEATFGRQNQIAQREMELQQLGISKTTAEAAAAKAAKDAKDNSLDAPTVKAMQVAQQAGTTVPELYVNMVKKAFQELKDVNSSGHDLYSDATVRTAGDFAKAVRYQNGIAKTRLRSDILDDVATTMWLEWNKNRG